MKIRRFAAAPAIIALAAGLIGAWGCNKKPTVPLVSGNQPPTVRITSAPLDTTTRNKYVITLNWIGFDPDGRVDHFEYAIDPPTDASSDTVWADTTANSITRSFPCPLPDRLNAANSSDFHVFVVRAVDNRGAISPTVTRAFWSYTQAPRVKVLNPPANPLVRYYVTPAVLFRWEGFDDDGQFTQKPVKYKFKMLTDNTEVSLATARGTYPSGPDSVRRYYAPRNWAGWDSVGGDTTEKQYIGLNPDQEYVFAIVAFDEAGAYSPLFTYANNMIYMRVTYSGAQNPIIGIFNEFFLYEYQAGSYRPQDPAQVVHIEVPAGRLGHPEDLLTFNWYALPVRDNHDNDVGGPIRTYRWAVDMVNPYDQTERSDEETDLVHWSQPSILATSCRIGPYPGGQVHRFFIEAEDVNNLRSLGMVEFTTVQASLDKSLLIVDDTRLLLDKININTNCFHSSNRPTGLWPTQAELDTFLYAVGGRPWNCYPAGTLSRPGIFRGYQFDTIGTNLRIDDLTIRLSKLGQYRHVLWLTDGNGALNSAGGTAPGDIAGPMTSMRYMNDNRKANTIAAYVRQGGLVWLAGGGAATAALINFNKTSNDNSEPNPRTTTFGFTEKELLPGRFIYDQAHWRSEFKQFKMNNGSVLRYPGRFQPVAGGPIGGGYGSLPAQIRPKSAATDTFPPNRTGQSASNFYQTQFIVEFLSSANEIIEDLDSGADEDFQSTLDTLYKAKAITLQPDTGPGALQSAVMTYYHGLENAPLIVTGFNLWNFRKSDCKDLVDFVLQRMWGLAPPTPAAATFASPGRPGSLAAGPPRVWSAPANARAAPLRQAPRDARPGSSAATGPRD